MEKVNQQSIKDHEELNLSEWGRILGISSNTFKMRALQTNTEIREGEPKKKNTRPQLLVKVSALPDIIKHIQDTARMLDGAHFHPWSLEADTSKDVFKFHPKYDPDTMITYQK